MGAQQSAQQPVPADLLENIRGRAKYNDKELQEWYNIFAKSRGSTISRQDFVFENLGYTRFGDEAFWNNVFELIDTNRQGTISFDEWAIALSCLSTSNFDEKIEWIFNSIDSNEDGYLTIDEIDRIVRFLDRVPGHGKVTTQEVFATLDRSKDGRLTLVEFREGLEKAPSLIRDLDVSNIIKNSLKHLAEVKSPKLGD
eukprot:TRINITY_DN3125_c0_g1_i2.p1 TRINITY_DN3125_c0_g1~~TRINITY_DN3125_c0_g1_i2.p1  ORF type:complete len:198 (-),score=55.16 TRINITY_DN3125_c0_g1_i2:63-656(-)